MSPAFLNWGGDRVSAGTQCRFTHLNIRWVTGLHRTPSPPSVFPQPAVQCYWPHPSSKSSAKYACSAWCRASLLGNSTFLSVAGGLSTGQAAVFLPILLTDLRSWLYIQPFQGIGSAVRRVCGLVDIPPCGSCFTLCLGRLPPWHQQMNHVLEIHPGPSVFARWWNKEKIITGPKKKNLTVVISKGEALSAS